MLAHNFTRWTATIGEIKPDDQQFTVTRTIRTRIYTIPGRIVNRSGKPVLRLPKHWPWADSFTRALNQTRALPQLA